MLGPHFRRESRSLTLPLFLLLVLPPVLLLVLQPLQLLYLHPPPPPLRQCLRQPLPLPSGVPSRCRTSTSIEANVFQTLISSSLSTALQRSPVAPHCSSCWRPCAGQLTQECSPPPPPPPASSSPTPPRRSSAERPVRDTLAPRSTPRRAFGQQPEQKPQQTPRHASVHTAAAETAAETAAGTTAGHPAAGLTVATAPVTGCSHNATSRKHPRLDCKTAGRLSASRSHSSEAKHVPRSRTPSAPMPFSICIHSVTSDRVASRHATSTHVTPRHATHHPKQHARPSKPAAAA